MDIDHPLSFSLLANLFLAAFLGVFPIVNPFSTVPLFLAVTVSMSRKRRRDQAWRACLYAIAILTIALLAGGLILQFFGISLAALRVAGGIIVAYTGMKMLYPPASRPRRAQQVDPSLQLPAPPPTVGAGIEVNPPDPSQVPGPHSQSRWAAEEEDDSNEEDFAFVPLALPSLSGPGAIAVIISFSTKIAPVPSAGRKAAFYLCLLAAVLATGALSYAILRAGEAVLRVLGHHGLEALTRLMGLILVCVGVQFVADGVRQFAHM